VFGDTFVTVMGVLLAKTEEGVKPLEFITYMVHIPPTGERDNEHTILVDEILDIEQARLENVTVTSLPVGRDVPAIVKVLVADVNTTEVISEVGAT
jgi:hypothetical protein